MPSTLTPTANGRMPYYPALDGVRAYAVLLVLYDHLKAGPHTLPWIDGHLGVDLFFLISGFLITTLLLREQRFTRRIDLRSFYLRRLFRILPVYLVVLALYLMLCRFPSQALHWAQLKPALPFFLTFTNEYARQPLNGSVFMHTWSLGVEEKFYLLWPLLLLLARTPRARALLLALCFAAAAIPPLLGHPFLATAYFGLLMGCLMAMLLAGPHAEKIFAAVARLPTPLPLLLLAAGFLAVPRHHAFMLLFSSAAVLFLTFLLARPSWLRTLHESPLLLWLGRRSYSMYLVHVLALNLCEALLPITSAPRAAAVLLASYALTALLADLLYRLIEQPARTFARNWLTRHHERPAAI